MEPHETHILVGDAAEYGENFAGGKLHFGSGALETFPVSHDGRNSQCLDFGGLAASTPIICFFTASSDIGSERNNPSVLLLASQ